MNTPTPKIFEPEVIDFERDSKRLRALGNALVNQDERFVNLLEAACAEPRTLQEMLDAIDYAMNNCDPSP